MSARKTSGFQDQDIFNVKVFLRSYNDAIECAKQMATREAASDHYKDYIKTLIQALKDDKVKIHGLSNCTIVDVG